MHLILFHDAGGIDTGLLRFALNQEAWGPWLIQTAYQGYNRRTRRTRFCVDPAPLSACHKEKRVILPSSWKVNNDEIGIPFSYDADEAVRRRLTDQANKAPWVVLTDGRYATHINMGLLQEQLKDTDADVVAVMSRPDLVGYRERFLVTQDNRLAGVRRFYEDSLEYQPFAQCQPHHIFIRSSFFVRVMKKRDSIPYDLPSFLQAIEGQTRKTVALGVAGNVLDLASESGFLSHWVQHHPTLSPSANTWRYWQTTNRVETVEGGFRVAGPVWVHNDAQLDPGVLLVGPCWVGPGAHLEADSVVDRTIVGSDVRIKAKQGFSSRVLLREEDLSAEGCPGQNIQTSSPVYENPFKHWPCFCYAGCVKRMVDILVACLVLILFLPVFPVIALAIKLNSPGPIFYGARRQGLHGKVFRCLKFRSMKPGSDKLQEQLRAINEVDGPQFKMADDPRISAVGRFLRETYLDEIPQFINVLKGEMSVVGPRPSPKVENTQCPAWRDARLSVRPGVTGLWQVKRTRDPVKDFQEWIQYDIEYVRRLSLKMDLWICWATFKSMVGKFAEQF